MDKKRKKGEIEEGKYGYVLRMISMKYTKYVLYINKNLKGDKYFVLVFIY